MQFLLALLPFLIPLILADRPLNIPKPHEQSCIGNQDGSILHYITLIGEPYNDVRCDAARDQVKERADFTAWYCAWAPDLERTHTIIRMHTTKWHADAINEIFGWTWPEVNGFNCPDF